MNLIANRLKPIKPSPTLEVSQRAQELRAEGLDIISLSAGEPDFNTPEHIVDAAKNALDKGMTRYTPVAGIPELRKAVANHSMTFRDHKCDASNVVVTVGAKQALYQFFQAVINPGDQVVIPAPYWVSYPDQVLLAGGEPVIAQTKAADGWVLKADELEKAVTSKTKAVVINTPSNPTGAVYSKEALFELVTKACKLGLWVVSDEIYQDLIYGDYEHTSVVSVTPPSYLDKIFTVDGVSKSYAMTGWRIGWGIGNPELIKAISKIQGQSTSNSNSIAQAAALAAITGTKDFLSVWREHYKERRDTMVKTLSSLPGVSCLMPDGAFYVLADFSSFLQKTESLNSGVELAKFLLDKAHVACVPGEAFGANGHIRFSYATSLDAINKAFDRISKALSSI